MSMPAELSENPYLRALTCMAVNPRIASLLLVDATYDDVSGTVAQLRDLVTWTTGREPRLVHIAPDARDDRLLGSYQPAESEAFMTLTWAPGALTQAPSEPYTIIQVNDLADLGPVAMRACLATLSADVAHVEREGMSAWWSPKALWVLKCDTRRFSEISPHLIDRIALLIRLASTQPATLTTRLSILRATFSPDAPASPFALTLSEAARAWLRQAAMVQPVVDEATLRDGYERFRRGRERHPALRRDLVYMQFAMAFAQLDHATAVSTAHFQLVDELLGGPSPEPAAAPTAPSTPIPSPPPRHGPRPPRAPAGESKERRALPPVDEFGPPPPLISLDPHDADALDLEPVADGAGNRSDLSDARGLGRDPLTLIRADMPGRVEQRGPAFGTAPAYDLSDISVTATLLASLLRPPAPDVPDAPDAPDTPPDWRHIRVLPMDYRQHLRLRIPTPRMVLVLDYTAINRDELRPYFLKMLDMAYIRRAEVHLIAVGRASARPLQAHYARFHSAQNPRLLHALSADPGRASPLADALFIARRALTGGASGAQYDGDDVLVVVTDARGNVPLAVSRQGAQNIDFPVGAQGVRDMLAEAARIGALASVESMVLSPPVDHLTSLPEELAARLHARLRYMDEQSDDQGSDQG